jgi:murein L,D-transpeptidase YcbB/YkuD
MPHSRIEEHDRSRSHSRAKARPQGQRVKLRLHIAPLAGVALALMAAACASDEPPAASPATPVSPAVLAAQANTDLGKRLAGPSDLTVAGEKLNTERLQRFYARHGFTPVWTTRPAKALTDAVLSAGGQGLSPDLFHGNMLVASTVLPPLERDLLLTDAYLAYADALARGALPVERRRDDEVLTPGPVDVTVALDAALDSTDPAAKIEGLAPSTPTYRALRQALRDNPAPARRQTIEVNLERERWLPRKLPSERVWVNVADQRLTMYRADQPALSMKVIVGQAGQGMQSPELQVPIDAIWFNPPWSIPADITANEIMPLAKNDPDYLAKHNLTMLPNGILQQKAGPYSALGTLMFDMNNKFDVYLHDTPSKEYFARDDRHISHGCIRIENPRDLAALVMGQPRVAIDEAIATGNTTRTPVPKPVPVFVVYETAFADADGKLQFRPDVYRRDTEIWQALNPKGQTVVAAR